MGYGNWFLLTFFLAFPAYVLLPWVRRMLNREGIRREPAGGS
jgi:PAT family beta-lactamase induction signal transducer AmpG